MVTPPSTNTKSYGESLPSPSVTTSGGKKVGAAVLAATPHCGGCREAVAAIVRSGQEIEPDSTLMAAYDDQFEALRTALDKRGYL